MIAAVTSEVVAPPPRTVSTRSPSNRGTISPARAAAAFVLMRVNSIIGRRRYRARRPSCSAGLFVEAGAHVWAESCWMWEGRCDLSIAGAFHRGHVPAP